MMRKIVYLVVVLSVLYQPLLAQEQQTKGKIGLNFGYPNFGVTWSLTNHIAVRPNITFSRSTSESSSFESKSRNLGLGISGLFYVHRWEGLRAYVSPQFAYRWSNVEISGSGSESKSHAYSVAGAGGMEYAVTKRFSLFGEAGISYGRNPAASSRSVGSFGYVGAILFLNSGK